MTGHPSDHERNTLLAAFLEDELTGSERRRVEALLQESSAAREHLDQLRAIRGALAAPIPELEQLDLRAAVRQAIANAPPQRPPRGTRAPLIASLAVAASLGLFATFQGTKHSGTDQADLGELRPKAARAPSNARPAPSLQVYVVRPGQAPLPLVSAIESNTSLLFSYSNDGPEPYRYLMAFAVDAASQVRWFYPAFVTASDDPISIPIDPGQVRRELPDAIEHDLERGELAIFALFTRQPMPVSEVERWLRAQAFAPRQPPRIDSFLVRIETAVR